MSQEQTIYEYIIIENQKHIWLPPPLNIGSPRSIGARVRSDLFKKYFKGYSNSILNKKSWERLKENHTVFRIRSGDMK